MAGVVEYVRVLCLEEIERFLLSSSIDEKQNILCGAMMNTVVCHENAIYFFDFVDLYFKKIAIYSKDHLTSLITQFIGTSLTILGRDNPRGLARLANKYDKEFKKFASFTPATLSTYKMKLSLPEELKFNEDNGIHFKNGRFDLATGTFAPRAVPVPNSGAPLISEVLDYEYQPSATESMKYLLDYLSNLYNDPETINYVLYQFARALRGDTSGCSCMFHVGQGSCGKTTIMKFIDIAVGSLYVSKLTSDVFDSATVAKRVFSELPNTARILMVSELNKKKKDSSVIKCVCDGEIVTTKLYKGGAHTIPIRGKLFATSNHAIAFTEDDSGIARRIKYILHRRVFTSNPAEVDNVNTFPAVDLGMENFTVDHKLSIFNLIAIYASDHYAYNVFPVMRSPADVLSGDTLVDIGSFLAQYFTSEEGAVVAKDTIVALATAYYQTIEVSEDVLISKITRYDVTPPVLYEKSRTLNNMRGVFVNIAPK